MSTRSLAACAVIMIKTMLRGHVRSLALCALIAVTEAHAQSVITTIAGTDWLFPGDGLAAVNAPLSGVAYGLDIAVDKSGNLYIADAGNFEVMRVGADGILSVFAGTGIPGVTGDGGPATSAALLYPTCVAVDSAGNVYIGGLGGDIRKVTPDGAITTIAGNAYNPGFSGDGGPAFKAQLSGVSGLAVDSAGNLFIADSNNFLAIASNNNRIREITADGIMHTIAGNGATGSGGDGGPATSAQLNGPGRLALDSAGNLYITDGTLSINGGSIRKIDAKGIITTVAGGGKSTSDGVQGTDAFLSPEAIVVDSGGNLYFADDSDGSTSSIRKINGQGVISTVAGGSNLPGFSGDGGPASQASFFFSSGAALALDASGNILFADNVNSRIRKITADGKINTIAGNGLYHFSGNNGPAASATLDVPAGMIGDASGNLYFTEPKMNRIRRIAPDQTISVIAGTGMQGFSGDGGSATSAMLAFPYFLAIAPDSSIVPAGSIVFSDRENCVIRAIDLKGNISTIAGRAGICLFNGDFLPPLQTSFYGPAGLSFDSGGDLLISEIDGNRVRELFATGSKKGTVQTIAGNGFAGFTGDGGPAFKAMVNRPAGLRAHGTGFYFCDVKNNVVRFVDLTSGNITTVAGNSTAAYSGDGGPAIKASLNIPGGLAFDTAGNMYIADLGNAVIRKVDTNGTISTFAGTFAGASAGIFAGTFTSPPPGDGGSPLDAYLDAPNDLYSDAMGNLFFTQGSLDIGGRVREVLTAPPSPTIQTSPAQLAFTAAAGSLPQDQGVDLTSLIAGSPVTVSISSTATWLSGSFTSARLPASLRVVVDPSSLSAGTYQGTVTVSSAYARPTSYPIAVTLTVTAAGQPSLAVSPTALTFAFVKSAPASARPILLSNVGGGSLVLTATTTTSSGGSWLRISPAGATLAAFGSAPLNVTADPTGLPPGTYSGVISISTTAIPVTMTINAIAQTILVPQTGLSFFAVQGGGSPPGQFFNILNTGSGILPWTVSASTLSGGPWLSVFPQSGQTDAGASLVPVVRVSIDPTGLSAGTYYGSVNISSSGAANSPQFVSVVLSVLPPGSLIGPIVQPSGLILTAVQGAQSPGAQTITVQGTTSTPVTFTSSKATIGGITTLPTAGTITANQPQKIVIQPDLTGLAPGVYRGVLTLSFSDGNVRTVSLVLVVLPSGSTVPTAERPKTTASCTPTTLAPVFTQLANGFSVIAGFPSQVSVKVVDDCANPMTAGGVIVGFDNGDTPIRLTTLKDGNWAGTWTPQHPSTQVLITANASIPEQSLKGQAQIKVGQQTGAGAPVISSGGVVNGASFAAQAPLAPGSLISLFGSNLAQSQASAGSLPLPMNLGGSSVQFGSTTVPLLFTSTGQVNAVIPYGMGVNTTQQVFVLLGSSISVPEPITLAGAAPGIFTVDGKQGIVFDGPDIADSAHPVKAGDVLVIYCTGLGEVSPAVVAGTPAPVSPLSTTVNTVTATIGGVPSTVQFAGLTPGFAGLYQVNAQVPAGVTAGNQVPLILSAAGQNSAPVTIAVQ